MDEQQKKALYGLTAIFSLIGAILLLAFPIGVWVTYPYYYYYISVGSAYAPLIILMALCLFYCMAINVLLIVAPEQIPDEKYIKYTLYTAFLAFFLCLIGGIAFLALASGALDWWLGAGFYGGLIGSLITMILTYIAQKYK